MNVILHPDKKGLGPKTKYHPPRSPSWLTESRAWLAAPSGLGPPSAQPSSLKEPGIQDPTGPQAPQAAQSVGRPGPTEGDPGRLLLLGRRDWDGGRAHGHLEAWATLVRALEPCRTQPSAYSLGPQAHPLVQGWMNWRAWGRPRATSYLTLHLTTTAPLLSESPH